MQLYNENRNNNEIDNKMISHYAKFFDISFYRKGAAWSGRLIFIKPDAANKFRQKVEANPDHLDRIKQALTSIETTSKLFSNLGIKHDIRRAD